MNTVPKPGSPESTKLGCVCPVYDNHYGRGRPYGDKDDVVFIMNELCPLHGFPKPEKKKK